MTEPNAVARHPLTPRLIYSARYDISFFGLERLHPFDGRKYSHAWRLLEARFGEHLARWWVQPPRQVAEDELLAVHTSGYLDDLRSPAWVALALELPVVRFLPAALVDRRILAPMRWACMGTIAGARAAMDHGLAVNLSGGYHHAKRDRGEGFCVYNDIALAVHDLRESGRLAATAAVAYVDLDAHQGNGVAHVFFDDAQLKIFDMYNAEIYPAHDTKARSRIDHDIPLPAFCPEGRYLDLLGSELPRFLDTLCASSPVELAIYNAGTDVLRGDPLGALDLGEEAIRQRDRFVIEQMTGRGIPTLILPSGGYNKASHRLIADTAGFIIERYGARQAGSA